MNEQLLNADRTKTVIVDGASLPWMPSPEPGVERRPLERIGGEVALATSIVRYRAGSHFAAHSHELGEEYFVLEGTFSDEDGHYPAGSYVRNPPGSRHAPFSAGGCVIFVKLRQMDLADSLRLRVLEADRVWEPAAQPGHERARLMHANGVSVQLERLAAGAAISAGTDPRGEEMFVLDGAIELSIDAERTALNRWGWMRRAQRNGMQILSPGGALLWVKRGHLC